MKTTQHPLTPARATSFEPYAVPGGKRLLSIEANAVLARARLGERIERLTRGQCEALLGHGHADVRSAANRWLHEYRREPALLALAGPPVHTFTPVLRYESALVGGGFDALACLLEPERINGRVRERFAALAEPELRAFAHRTPHLAGLVQCLQHVATGRFVLATYADAGSSRYFQHVLLPCLAAFVSEGLPGLQRAAEQVGLRDTVSNATCKLERTYLALNGQPEHLLLTSEAPMRLPSGPPAEVSPPPARPAKRTRSPADALAAGLAPKRPRQRKAASARSAASASASSGPSTPPSSHASPPAALPALAEPAGFPWDAPAPAAAADASQAVPSLAAGPASEPSVDGLGPPTESAWLLAFSEPAPWPGAASDLVAAEAATLFAGTSTSAETGVEAPLEAATASLAAWPPTPSFWASEWPAALVGTLPQRPPSAMADELDPLALTLLGPASERPPALSAPLAPFALDPAAAPPPGQVTPPASTEFARGVIVMMGALVGHLGPEHTQWALTTAQRLIDEESRAVRER